MICKNMNEYGICVFMQEIFRSLYFALRTTADDMCSSYIQSDHCTNKDSDSGGP